MDGKMGSSEDRMSSCVEDLMRLKPAFKLKNYGWSDIEEKSLKNYGWMN